MGLGAECVRYWILGPSNFNLDFGLFCRVIIKLEELVITDSGEIFDTTISGGRVGLLVYMQPGAIFTHVEYSCNDR